MEKLTTNRTMCSRLPQIIMTHRSLCSRIPHIPQASAPLEFHEQVSHSSTPKVERPRGVCPKLTSITCSSELLITSTECQDLVLLKHFCHPGAHQNPVPQRLLLNSAYLSGLRMNLEVLSIVNYPDSHLQTPIPQDSLRLRSPRPSDPETSGPSAP